MSLSPIRSNLPILFVDNRFQSIDQSVSQEFWRVLKLSLTFRVDLIRFTSMIVPDRTICFAPFWVGFSASPLRFWKTCNRISSALLLRSDSQMASEKLLSFEVEKGCFREFSIQWRRLDHVHVWGESFIFKLVFRSSHTHFLTRE